MTKSYVISILLGCSSVAMLASANIINGISPPKLRADQSSILSDPNHLTFRVCGNYCGPNWCSNEVISEENCVAQGVWGIPSSGEAVDSCCRTHDYCCGSGQDRPACNDAIVACIQNSRAYDTICGAAVWAAMKVVSGWCCGSACPVYIDPSVPLTLAGKSFSDGVVRIAFSNEGSYTVEVLVPQTENNEKNLLCMPQSYSLGDSSEELTVSLSAIDSCGQQVSMASSPNQSRHPLFDASAVMYWPSADVLAVTKKGKDGGVLMIERLK